MKLVLMPPFPSESFRRSPIFRLKLTPLVLAMMRVPNIVFDFCLDHHKDSPLCSR